MALPTPVSFPLFAILNDPDTGPRCACGDASCSRVGKHPRVKWRDLKLGDEVPFPEPGEGYGIKTGAAPKGSGVFVVDIDGIEADASWAELQDFEETKTYTVETGRGWQLYFVHPGFPVKNSAGELAPGIDIRGDGGFVVGPGSPHKSGKTYRASDPGAAVCVAPDWLLEWLRARVPDTPTQTYPGDVTDPEELAHRKNLYTKWLRNEAPARGPERRGQGDKILFDVVQRGAYDLQLPTQDVLDLVREHYDPRCNPPWGDELPERVKHKAHDAKTKSTRPRAEPMPRDVPLFLEPPPLPSLPAPDPNSRKRKRRGIIWGGWDEPPEAVDYLVEGLMPIDTVGMFVAMGSSLKTWTALDIARNVSKGGAWLDRFPTKQGRALVVDFESGMYELRRRIHLLEGGEISDLGAWCYPDGLRIDHEDFWKEIAKIDGLRFVVIDSLAAGAPGVDENLTNAAMPLKLAALFTEAFPESEAPTVLFIHHARKDDGGDERKMVRGSTAIFADCDWVYKFDSVEETRAGRRMRMVCTKPAMGPKPDPVNLELTAEGRLVWFDETNGDAKAVSFDNSPEAIQAGIKLALAGGVYISTREKVAKAVGRRNQIVSPELDELIVKEEIVFIKGAGYCLDNDETRTKRVLSFVEGFDRWRSEATLAKASSVSTEMVRKLIREGKICQSGDGRWLVVSA